MLNIVGDYHFAGAVTWAFEGPCSFPATHCKVDSLRPCDPDCLVLYYNLGNILVTTTTKICGHGPSAASCYLASSPETFCEYLLPICLGILHWKMAGIFGEFFLVSVSHEMKHENSSKKFGENSERNSRQNSVRKFEKFEELSFCDFSNLTNCRGFLSYKTWRVFSWRIFLGTFSQ